MSAGRDPRTPMIAALARYWPERGALLEALPVIAVTAAPVEPLPPNLAKVTLPEWAADLAPADGLLIPAYTIADGDGPSWQRTDWWQAAYWYLHCVAERAFEDAHGPIHSYSHRLSGWDPAMWERAWVNRIALFLRRWAARHAGTDEAASFGALPEAEIVMTHDVDAVNKTMAIRLKQSAFNGFNSVRRLLAGKPGAALSKAAQAGRFFAGADSYWFFNRISELEERHGVRSCFNLYGGGGGWKRAPKKLLFDPAYDIARPDLALALRRLAARGWQMGVHQSFGAWSDAGVMAGERQRVEQALGQPVTTCRQHWLRFSWRDTWAAQQQAGFRLDTTLGFNDRPGFRCGAALRFDPLIGAQEEACALQAMPMVLMDSHLYDYLDLDEAGRQIHMRGWLDEVRLVRGQATVIWHTHVLAADYGWADGFEHMLALLERSPA